MAKHRNEHVKKALAWVASIALVAGLVPIPALAFAEEARGTGPDAPTAMDAGEGASQSEASPAPDAGTMELQPTAGADAPDVTSEAVPNEAAAGAAPNDAAGAAEGQSAEAAEQEGAQVTDSVADDDADATVTGEPEGVEGAEEDGEDGKENAESEGDGKGKDGDDDAEKAESPAFSQSSTVGGVTVTVEADAGAFPKDAKLSVASAPTSATEAAVAAERDAGSNVAVSYTFDVKVLDKDGKEVQPEGGMPVRVSFAAAEVADPNLETSVYHVSGSAAEELPVSESGSTATAQSDGFSYYTVEFTYGELQYVLQGDGEVALADILATVGLTGEPTDVEVSDPALFSASDESGQWVVSSHQAFSSEEWMRVTISGNAYEIKVTDNQTSGECGGGLTWTLSDEGVFTISKTAEGDGMMADTYIWAGNNSIKSIVVEDGVKSICKEAFTQCDSLESVVFQGSLVSIGDFAFSACDSLSSVVFKGSLGSLGSNAFAGCPKTIQFYCYGSAYQWQEIKKYKWGNAQRYDDHYVSDYVASTTTTSNPANGGTTKLDWTWSEAAYTTEAATLTATPAEGSRFVNWTKGGEVVSAANPYSFTVTSALAGEYVANFGPNTYEITTNVNDENGGEVEGGGPYKYGEKVTLTATPKAGYVFDCWTVDTDPSWKGEDPQLTFDVEADQTYKAWFWKVSIGGVDSAYEYTGNQIRPTPSVYLVGVDGAGAELVGGVSWYPVPGADYTLDYGENVHAGEGAGSVTVTFTEDFAGEAAKTFSITPASLADAEVSVSTEKRVYDGTAQKPDPTVTWHDKPVEAEDYTVTYSDNVRAGTATVTVTGKRNFKDTTSASATFEIKARPLTITANDQSYTYTGYQQGEGDPAYDDPAVIETKVEVDGLQDNDAITSIVLSGMGTDAKAYEGAIVPSAASIGANGELNDNYDITYVNGTLTIAPKPATITVESASKAQGAADPAFTGKVEGLVKDGDLGEITYKRTNSDEAPGTYKGVITATYTENGNYDVTVVNGDFTIEAAPAKKGTLTFDLAGGTLDGKTGTVTIEANVGETIKLPGAPTKDGYTFKYWKGSEYEAGADYEVEGDHAFTAEWEKNTATTHTVTFDANGHGTAPAAQQVEDGKRATRPANPTADGWTFGGWYADRECKQAYDFSSPVTSDITLYAKWTQKAKAAATSGRGSSGSTARTGDAVPSAVPIALAIAAASGLALAALAMRRRGAHAACGRHARR